MAGQVVSARTFRLTMSERCYRFKPDALGSHAPRKPGVYEFVAFNERMEPEVLYVGLALPGGLKTIFDALAAHMMGNVRPTAEDLFKAAKDVYFDYVLVADVDSPEDFKDIAGALMAKHKPRLNPPGAPLPSSGKYPKVELQEAP